MCPRRTVRCRRLRLGEGVTSLRRAANFQTVVTQAMRLPASYTLSVERAIRPWDAAAELSQSLGLGSVDFWEIDGKPGDIDPLEGRNGYLTAALTRTGKYKLAIRASGDGGSGACRMRPGGLR